ncbi:MAG: polysaccharide deacetylase family protein [Hyphomicrobiaceae bacterium]
MSRTRTGLLKSALSALHFTGADRLLAPLTRGVGVIFMLHSVRPTRGDAFGPNRILEITPEFLEQVIGLVGDSGFDVVSLDDAHARLREGDFDRPFAAFTFDDGYRDNRDFAYPIFKKHNLPFAVYVPSDFADGRGDLWWLKLEMVIAARDAISARVDGVAERFATATRAEKEQVFSRIYWWLRSISEFEARRFVSELCETHGVDTSGLCRDLIMNWHELRDFAQDPLVTIGAHTRRHLALAKLTLSEARLEIEESVRRLERELARPIRHFSFPYGDETSAGARDFELAQELGLQTAVTTRKGLIHERDANLTTSLPRVSLNGDFQSRRYVKVMLSGAPFAFWDMARLLRPETIAARSGSGVNALLTAGTSIG